MRFRLRMIVWGARAACEQALVLGVGGLSALLAVVMVLLVVASLLLRIALPRLEAAQDRRLARVATDLPALSAVPPSSPPNTTAELLDSAAAELGIALASASATRGRQPSRDAAVALEEVAAAFLDPRQPLQWPGAGRYVAWRAANRHQIDAVVAAALDGDPPRWQVDPDRRAPLGLDLVGMRRLQGVLLSEVWIRVVEHRSVESTRVFEASWRLNEQLLDGPDLAAHDAAIAILEDQLAMLPSAFDPDVGWEARLGAVDPLTGARRAYLFEAWRLRRRARTLLATRQRELGLLVQPFARLAAMPQRTVLADAVTRLRPAAIGSFDSGAFAALLDHSLPRWNTFARDAMPSSWQSWPRSVHAALALALTRHTLAVRRSWRADATLLDRLPESWPEPLTDGRWTCRLDDERLVIRLEPAPVADGAWPPLEQVIHLARTTAEAR